MLTAIETGATRLARNLRAGRMAASTVIRMASGLSSPRPEAMKKRRVPLRALSNAHWRSISLSHQAVAPGAARCLPRRRTTWRERARARQTSRHVVMRLRQAQRRAVEARRACLECRHWRGRRWSRTMQREQLQSWWRMRMRMRMRTQRRSCS